MDEYKKHLKTVNSFRFDIKEAKSMDKQFLSPFKKSPDKKSSFQRIGRGQSFKEPNRLSRRETNETFISKETHK
jgi:hypothetical protein